MPAADKKWDAAAERDLCVAIIMGNQETDRVRYNWAKVHALMERYGYPFSKDAISQHFSKVIMKDFKARHTGSAPATPIKRTPAARGGSTSGKRGRPKAIKGSADADDEDHEMETPTKKSKRAPAKNDDDDDDDDDGYIKPEEGDGHRDRSATLLDNEDEYQAWLNADSFES